MKKSFILQLALVGASLLILLYVRFANHDTRVLPTKVTVPFAEDDVRTFVSKEIVTAAARKKASTDSQDDQTTDEPDQGIGPGVETEYNAAETVYNAPAETTDNAPAATSPIADPPKG
ncbi:hypothetical protein BH09SUM1_BH09SUM1_20200 [soil metagenome]